MYYRRKIILSILEEYGGKLGNASFQKILFLITQWQTKRSFDFVPYRYGCFSFQANQDLLTLGKYKLVDSLTINKLSIWALTDGNSNFQAELTTQDLSAIKSVKRETQDFSTKELVRHTYIHYPYYATKSLIAEKILSENEMIPVRDQKIHIESSKFFTIGYEGISLENYLNKLIANDVKLLCDVRKNSFSMKYGFSKSQLKKSCESIGIKYIHIPDLGIESSKRQKLNTLTDYHKLFEEYENTTLKEKDKFLLYLIDLIKKYKRVAITCFEKEVCMCHRGRILKALTSLPVWNIPYKNL